MRLACRFWGTPTEKTPLLILHGLYGASANWGEIGRALGSERQVFALDARNHGASPQAPSMSYAEMAQDLREFCEAEKLSQVALLGHSMGGKTAMAATLLWPHLVASLMVADIAPTPYPPEHGREHQKILLALGACLSPLPKSRKEAKERLIAQGIEEEVADFLLMNLRPQGEVLVFRVPLDVIEASLPDLLDFPQELPPSSVPTLFLAGKRSDYFWPFEAQTRHLFPSSQVVSLDAGHWLHVQAKEEFLSAVKAFLSSR